MKILIACEMSGRVRNAFIKKGHDAISCDLLSSWSKGPHYKGDVFDIINDGFDMLIAFPPCTHLCVSGAKHFHKKQEQQKEAIRFVKRLYASNIPKIAIENPVGVLSTRWKKPTQIIEPYQFGHQVTKRTCLWLWGLPPLESENNVKYEMYMTKTKKQRQVTQYYSGYVSMRSIIRSLTFQGIANAMANQWG